MALGLPGDLTAALLLLGVMAVVGGVGGYGIHSLRRRSGREESEELAQLRTTLTGLGEVGLVVPENPSIDALAAAIGLQTLTAEWGMNARVFTEGTVTAEDATAFCNIFDLDPVVIGDTAEELADVDGVVAVGGGGPIPSFGSGTPVVAVIRHRPATADHPMVIARSTDGATSTAVARLLEEANVVPEQREATALLYGVRAGTREFRRVRSQADYEAASFLHDFADHGRIEALRAPGMSGDTFDIIGQAIQNRERRASFAVTNVGTVPSVGALEEGADTLLRLDGVSSAAVFGVHEDTVVAACRAEDVRTNAIEVLESAFEYNETVGGNADAATARIPLGLFARVDEEHEGTLDDLIDASTRKALFAAFEGS